MTPISLKAAHIKFNAYNVRNTQTGAKAKVHYSLDNQADGRKVVTIYDREYGHDLQKVFNDVAVGYENDTDSMQDYFAKGRVRIYETSPIYVEARAAVEKIIADLNAKREARWQKRQARFAASRPQRVTLTAVLS